MPMKKALAAAWVATLCISSTVLADPLVIKFSHVVSPDTPKGKGADNNTPMAK